MPGAVRGLNGLKANMLEVLRRQKATPHLKPIPTRSAMKHINETGVHCHPMSPLVTRNMRCVLVMKQVMRQKWEESGQVKAPAIFRHFLPNLTIIPHGVWYSASSYLIGTILLLGGTRWGSYCNGRTACSLWKNQVTGNEYIRKVHARLRSNFSRLTPT